MTLTNVKDFTTVGGAAAMLGVSKASVIRYIEAGHLTRQTPVGHPAERDVTLLLTAEVLLLAKARRLVGRA